MVKITLVLFVFIILVSSVRTWRGQFWYIATGRVVLILQIMWASKVLKTQHYTCIRMTFSNRVFYRGRKSTHYRDIIMTIMTSLTTVYSIIYSGTDQRKRQSYTSLAFVRGIHRWPVTWKTFPFDDTIMKHDMLISDPVSDLSAANVTNKD